MVNTIDIAKLRAISEILNFNSESKIKEPNYNMLNVNTNSAALYGGGGGGGGGSTTKKTYFSLCFKQYYSITITELGNLFQYLYLL